MTTINNLRELFLRERKKFALMYPHLTDAQLMLKRFKRYTERDVALCYPNRLIVVFHTDAYEGLTDQQATALIRHELAHLAQPEVDEAGTDRVAEFVTGRQIRYDENDIQTTGRGVRPRPKRLPK